jgi:hypothetical protein
MPRALGCPPSRTIAALAERTAALILTEPPGALERTYTMTSVGKPVAKRSAFGSAQAGVTIGAKVGDTGEQDSARLYTVWYGTNRRPVDPNDPSRGFSGRRSYEVSYGACAVAIPRSHKFGSVGSPWWKRWLVLTDDRLHLRELRHLSQD